MGRSKLSHTDVLDIRDRIAKCESLSAIARDFGVCQSHISRIKSGSNRRGVSDRDIALVPGQDFCLNGVSARVIPSHTTYAATTEGDIYSRKTGGWKKLRLTIGEDGYYRLYSQDETGRIAALVNRLVLEAFCGYCPDGMECRHLDGNKTNNRLENLAWGTHQQNINDKTRHGTILKGEQVGNSKLTETEVRDILATPQSVSSHVLAKRFNVNARHIRRIRQRVRWAHVA